LPYNRQIFWFSDLFGDVDAHERRPLVLASFSQEFVATLVVLTSSQADPVYFFLTKPVREPIFLPAIVTTAKLFYCSFDAADVNVAASEIPYDKVSITEHPYLLYEYPLPRFLQHAPKDVASVLAINGWETFIRLDILVINSSAFSDILSQLAVTPK